MRGEILQILGLAGLCGGLWGVDWRLAAGVCGALVFLLGFFDGAQSGSARRSARNKLRKREGA